MDLAVGSADFENARRVLEEAMTLGLAIDLHNELRHLDTVPWADLFENSVTVDVEGTNVRFLRPEDHLRVLCIHWLTDGGAQKDRLWDVYYLLDNRQSEFDWSGFLDVVESNRRRWLICTVGLAEKFLGLDLSGTPLQGAGSKLPQWLIRAVEREWASDVRVIPLSSCLRDPKLLFEQLRKRFPPNPIQATIDQEGSFDAGTRIGYQIFSGLKRMLHASRMSPQKN
jgi:hypothetical protein